MKNAGLSSILIAMTLLTVVVIADAQQPKVVRIGFLGPNSAASTSSRIESLRAGLRDLGYVEGKNLVIESRWADGNYDRLPDLATELVGLKVDLILTSGTPGTRAARSGSGRGAEYRRIDGRTQGSSHCQTGRRSRASRAALARGRANCGEARCARRVGERCSRRCWPSSPFRPLPPIRARNRRCVRDFQRRRTAHLLVPPRSGSRHRTRSVRVWYLHPLRCCPSCR